MTWLMVSPGHQHGAGSLMIVSIIWMKLTLRNDVKTNKRLHEKHFFQNNSAVKELTITLVVVIGTKICGGEN